MYALMIMPSDHKAHIHRNVHILLHSHRILFTDIIYTEPDDNISLCPLFIIQSSSFSPIRTSIFFPLTEFSSITIVLLSV